LLRLVIFCLTAEVLLVVQMLQLLVVNCGSHLNYIYRERLSLSSTFLSTQQTAKNCEPRRKMFVTGPLQSIAAAADVAAVAVAAVSAAAAATLCSATPTRNAFGSLF